MKRIIALVPVLVLSLIASGVLLAQNNPFVGTWTLNLAKSKFSGMQAPKSATRTVTAQGSDETVAYLGIASNGSQFGYSFMTNRDGKGRK
jgi:hypothetical protein